MGIITRIFILDVLSATKGSCDMSSFVKGVFMCDTFSGEEDLETYRAIADWIEVWCENYERSYTLV